MKDIGDAGIDPNGKSRSTQSSGTPLTSNGPSQSQDGNIENFKKSNLATPKITCEKDDGLQPGATLKTEEVSESKSGQETPKCKKARRPKTASAVTSIGAKKRVDAEENCCSPSSRTVKVPCSPEVKKDPSEGSSGNNASSPNPGKEKKQISNASRTKRITKSKRGVDFAEGADGNPLLLTAVEELRGVTEMLRTAKEKLRTTLTENNNGEEVNPKIKSIVAGYHDALKLSETSRSQENVSSKPSFFEQNYSTVLHEVFHVWIHLFSFIINLRINLIKIANSSGAETFQPNAETERSIINRAIESAKIFSQLKMKMLVDSLEEFGFANRGTNNVQLLNHEDRISSPFLSEMDFMGEKAKEILREVKKIKTTTR